MDTTWYAPHAERSCAIDRAGRVAQFQSGEAFFVEDVPEPHELGVFEFHHDWGYGPYARDTVPAKPIVLADLPEPLRERIEALRLRAATFTDESLDPEAHAPCYRYGEG
jgi:hypothetical protein